MPKLVAVTGATGFIGHALMNKLVKDGWKVRALTRTVRSDSESIRWIQGDLDNSIALHHLVDGVAYVIHCAGAVRGNSYNEFAQTNITGTQNLLSALSEQTQSLRFLLISSLAARQPELSWYAKSKYLAEQKVSESIGDRPWAIFRPTAVYGPGDKALKPLFQATRRGILPVVGKTDNRFGLIHVDDLIAAIQLWLVSDSPINGTYELDDGTPGGYSYQSLAALAERVWERPVRCITIPSSLIRGISILNLWLSRQFHYSPMLTPGKVNELQHCDWVCNNTPLTHALPAWQPSIRLQESLPQVI